MHGASSSILVCGVIEWWTCDRERALVRRNRIKVDPGHDQACYHCVTRTVNGAFLFDESSKETLRRMIWRVADFCGVEVLTYAILSNHFHVLVRVPRRSPVADEELLRRYAVLHPESPRHPTLRLSVLRAQLAANGEAAEDWRRRQLELMGDVSQFMKLLKQRFSIWFNKANDRFGTLWAERFTSVLVECNEHVLATVAAYVDLNCVRAGLADDPKDYRYCGYAEAVAGSAAARSGLGSIFSSFGWRDVQARYRMRLFAAGSAERSGAARIPASEFAKVVAAKGRLPLPTILLCRLRYLTRGAVLGGRSFVQCQAARLRTTNSVAEGVGGVPLPPVADWGDLMTLTAVRS